MNLSPETIARNTVELVSLPRVYHRVSEMLADGRYGAAEIGRVVASEPALTARLLRMVNSAYYGLPTRVDTVPMAISVLGTRALHELVLASSVASAFDRLDTGLVDVADFWHHSIYCGLTARLIAKDQRLGQSEQAFVAGLLHDIGKLALYREAPDAAETVLRRFAADEGETPVFRLESEVLGFDHAAVGAALLRTWDLPEAYASAVAHHHDPGSASEYRELCAVVHVANTLSKKVEPGHKIQATKDTVPTVDDDAAAIVSLDGSTVEHLRVEADLQSIEVYATLFGR